MVDRRVALRNRDFVFITDVFRTIARIETRSALGSSFPEKAGQPRPINKLGKLKVGGSKGLALRNRHCFVFMTGGFRKARYSRKDRNPIGLGGRLAPTRQASRKQ